MPKATFYLSFLLLLGFWFFLNNPIAQAAGYCEGRFANYVSSVVAPDVTVTNNLSYRINLRWGEADSTYKYKILLTRCSPDSLFCGFGNPEDRWSNENDDPNQIKKGGNSAFFIPIPDVADTFYLKLYRNNEEICKHIGSVQVVDSEISQAACSLDIPGIVKKGDSEAILAGTVEKVKDVNYNLYLFYGTHSYPLNKIVDYSPLPPEDFYHINDLQKTISGNDFTFSSIGGKPDINQLDVGKYTAVIEAYKDRTANPYKRFSKICGLGNFEVSERKDTTKTTPTPIGQQLDCSGDKCSKASGISCDPTNGDIDKVVGTHNGILTAIGCVPTEPTALIKGLMKIATGAGGGIALLLMIAGVFKIITSSGNPDALKSGQEQITNAVIGLLFIIFSVLLLQIIGVNILDIKGLN